MSVLHERKATGNQMRSPVIRHLGAICTVRRHLVGVVLATAAFAAVGAAPSLAAVRWDLRTVANTTAIAGGQVTYNVHVVNVGDTDTDGTEVRLDVQLPAGLTLSAAGSPLFPWDCSTSIVGSMSATCTTSQTFLHRVGAGGYPDVKIAADVARGASGLLTTQFTVHGGAAGGDPSARAVDPTLIASGPDPFAVDGFDGQLNDASGDPFTQAGGHPDDLVIQLGFSSGDNPRHGALWPVEPVKTIVVDTPPGIIGNPTATGGFRCTPAQLANSEGVQERPLCPAGSQVGTVLVTGNAPTIVGLPAEADVALPLASVFNMVTPPNAPARFGFNIAGVVVTLTGRVRSDGDYGVSVVSANVPAALATLKTELTLWGVPADASHTPQRSCPGEAYPSQGGPACGTDVARAPFLRLPTSCEPTPGSPVTDGIVTSVHLDSWFNPGATLANGAPDLGDLNWKSASFTSHLPPGFPADPNDPSTPWGRNQLPTGCDRVPFDPRIGADPKGPAVAGQPVGFVFDVSLPQRNNPDTLAEQSDLRKAVVTLPPGVHVSPSSAQGLGACTEDQVGLHSMTDATCPDASKLGTATIETPLLEDPLQGAVYLAKPHENPFRTLLALYLVVRGPGVSVKLPGRIDPDPRTGQLRATFDDNPQLPFSNLRLEFKDGPRAPLVNPVACGSHTTTAQMTGWNGRTVDIASSFDVSADGHGAPCSPQGFAPRFTAGVENPIAGASSPLQVQITRSDADQQLGGLTLHTPDGLLGHINRVDLCSDGDARAATCPESSRIGSVTVGAGAGPNPFYITNGRAYLTEGYRGVPFGLAVVVPAVAGPFDLGNVVVRQALFVDRHDATLRIVSDPLPTILQGIPLDVRDVRVQVDRSGFMVNPTSCDEQRVGGTLQSTTGTNASVSTRFQLADCERLGFKPRMTLRIGSRGHTYRNAAAPFSTRLTMPARNQANLRSVRVTLPRTINARLTVINDACTRAEFESDISKCVHAKAGTATAVTPLLRDPLKGSVYFVKNGHPIPDLFVALRGQVDFDLIGRVTIPGGKRLATTFDTAPDVPIRSFSLRLFGGSRNGSVGAAANLCTAKSRRQKAKVDYIGQNGKVLHVNQRLQVRGCKVKAEHRGGKRGRGAGHRRGR